MIKSLTLKDQMKEAFIIIGCHYGIATFIDFKSKTVCFVFNLLNQFYIYLQIQKIFLLLLIAFKTRQFRINRKYKSYHYLTKFSSNRFGYIRD